jgi:hypothetical protein
MKLLAVKKGYDIRVLNHLLSCAEHQFGSHSTAIGCRECERLEGQRRCPSVYLAIRSLIKTDFHSIC